MHSCCTGQCYILWMYNCALWNKVKWAQIEVLENLTHFKGDSCWWLFLHIIYAQTYGSCTICRFFYTANTCVRLFAGRSHTHTYTHAHRLTHTQRDTHAHTHTHTYTQTRFTNAQCTKTTTINRKLTQQPVWL